MASGGDRPAYVTLPGLAPQSVFVLLVFTRTCDLKSASDNIPAADGRCVAVVMCDVPFTAGSGLSLSLLCRALVSAMLALHAVACGSTI